MRCCQMLHIGTCRSKIPIRVSPDLHQNCNSHHCNSSEGQHINSIHRANHARLSLYIGWIWPGKKIRIARYLPMSQYGKTRHFDIFGRLCSIWLDTMVLAAAPFVQDLRKKYRVMWIQYLKQGNTMYRHYRWGWPHHRSGSLFVCNFCSTA